MLEIANVAMKCRLVLFGALLALAACGGDEDCKNACDIISSCGLKSSGLSCDSTCDQGGCAACVSDTECADIESGACSADCPGVSFSKDTTGK
jgi:hypothetical protein